MSTTQLIYVGDPMCSWCYGFGKELSKVQAALPDLPLRIVVGGVRAGSTEVLDDAGKRFRLAHWARVEALSGLPFNREAFTAHQGLVYDTEPVCRAVVVARLLAPEVSQLTVFRALQGAFYADGRDTTQVEVLVQVLASVFSDAGKALPPDTIADCMRSQQALTLTQQDFIQARQWGINSFPQLLLQQGDDLRSLAPGYTKAEDILQALRAEMV